MSTQCVICTRPVADQAYACAGCADRIARHLAEIADLAPAARAVAAGQTRRGPAVGGHGGGGGLPINLAAGARMDAVTNALGGWVRVVIDERGGRLVLDDGDPLAAVACWLAGHVEWWRHRQQVDEFAGDVEHAARVLRGVVDGPAARVIVGACECRTVLYARTGAKVARCRECEREWDVDESREILLRHVDGMLLTAAEIAGLAVVQDPERVRPKVRKLINMWAARGGAKGGLDQRGRSVDGDPTYAVGEVLARLAEAEDRRTRRDMIGSDTVRLNESTVPGVGSAA
nr:hypothetical protein [Micromonospora sp. DSM 115978]